MTSDTAPADTTRLARRITPWLLFLFILGDVLGAGIYALAGELSREAGGLMWAPLALALVMALLTAASYAELVTKYPKAGGAAVFAQRAFKRPWVSFVVGFAMLAAGVTSAAGLAIAFAGDYLSTFLDVPVVLAAPLFLFLLALLNARGIRESVRSNVAMTVVEVSGLVLVIVVVGIAVGRGQGDAGRLVELPPETGVASAVLGGALLAFYSFVGFEVSANVAEEVQDVSRVYPGHSSVRWPSPVSSTRSSASPPPSSCRRGTSPAPPARCSTSSPRPGSVSRSGPSPRSRSSPSPTARC